MLSYRARVRTRHGFLTAAGATTNSATAAAAAATVAADVIAEAR
jgi:hypothetical protein